MNNKLLSYSLIGIQILILILVGVLVFGRSTSRLGGTTNYDALDVSDGYYVDGTQVITGSGVWSGAITTTGDVRIKSPVITGASSTLTAAATTSITAAQACDNALVNFNPTALTVGSTTLPTAAAMIADCLTTDGDSVQFTFRNLSTATTTQIVIGDASTTLVSSANTGDIVQASGWTLVRIMKLATLQIMVIVEDLVDAD